MLENFIVDNIGRLFKTIKATRRGNYFPFWKFEFFNPLIYIDLEIEKVKNNFDLQELKITLLKIIISNNGLEIIYENNFKHLIDRANTYADVISLVEKQLEYS